MKYNRAFHEEVTSSVKNRMHQSQLLNISQLQLSTMVHKVVRIQFILSPHEDSQCVVETSRTTSEEISSRDR